MFKKKKNFHHYNHVHVHVLIVALHCGPLPEIANAHTVSDSTRTFIGSTQEIVCEDGLYFGEGETLRTVKCGIDLEWKGNFESCRSKLT